MIRFIKYSILVVILSLAFHEVYVYYQNSMAESQEHSSAPLGESAALAEDVKIVMIGATGATGRYVFAELIKDKRFSKITAIGRRPASIPEDFEGAKGIDLEEEVKSGRVEQVNDIDLNKEITKETVGKQFEGKDVFISCFGTTRKAAGSAAEFRRIDKDINVNMAHVAKEMNVPFYSIMSSSGANANSWFLYLQVKGEIDEEAKSLDFERTSIWRPGMLGRGNELRFVEKIFSKVMHSIPTKVVAKAIVKDALMRLRSDKKEDKQAKIYDNTAIYAFSGLDSKGNPFN